MSQGSPDTTVGEITERRQVVVFRGKGQHEAKATILAQRSAAHDRRFDCRVSGKNDNLRCCAG
jgi:hypothetical protein